MQRRQRRRQCYTTHESNEERGKAGQLPPLQLHTQKQRKQKHKWDIHPSSKGKQQTWRCSAGVQVGEWSEGVHAKGAYEHAHNLDPRRQHATCTQTPHKQGGTATRGLASHGAARHTTPTPHKRLQPDTATTPCHHCHNTHAQRKGAGGRVANNANQPHCASTQTTRAALHLAGRGHHKWPGQHSVCCCSCVASKKPLQLPQYVCVCLWQNGVGAVGTVQKKALAVCVWRQADFGVEAGRRKTAQAATPHPPLSVWS